MTFNDIIKKSFLEQFNTVDISAMSIMISLLVALLLGGFVFWIYRSVCTKSFYSKNFAISLIVISLITTIVIMTVKSNLIISLGMVGALSIVRFRTPIKEPIDLAFLFWSIAIGIICGAGTYQIAFIGSLIIFDIDIFHIFPNYIINTIIFE